MELKYKPQGSYLTNCYIVKTNEGEIIIDPGVGAFEWVQKEVKKPLAILNTHGHFDHVWSNQILKTHYNIPIYCPKDDVFMLKSDPYHLGMEPSCADVEVNGDESFKIGGEEVKFWHFPGHTPGCSAIEIGSMFFSGDFVFADSIGRTDFPFSSPEDMKKSLLKFLKIEKDMPLYPGHGFPSTIAKEQYSAPRWIKIL
ncbi:MAG: MBL fold metallo-hydrolase [Sulfurospirillaceae bacterium]|nr:MBL fold metallo-hydrolase [Sulfurospirillaceae bacterium]